MSANFALARLERLWIAPVAWPQSAFIFMRLQKPSRYFLEINITRWWFPMLAFQG
jgi:hypothetical protein